MPRVSEEVRAVAEEAIRTLYGVTSSSCARDMGSIVTLTAVVEALIDNTLDELVAASPVQDSALGRAMVGKTTKLFRSTWEDRNYWLKNGFEIALAGSRPGQDFRVLVELRNALAHGAGSLTERQCTNLKAFVELRKNLMRVLDVDVQGRAIILGDASVSRATEVAVLYILAFERHNRVRYGS